MIKPNLVYCGSCDYPLEVYDDINIAVAEARKRPGLNVRYIVTETTEGRNLRIAREEARNLFPQLAMAYGEQCLICATNKHLLVDHIIPLKRGGTSEIDNLQILCRVCNFRKGLKIIDYRPFPFRVPQFDEEVVIPSVA